MSTGGNMPKMKLTNEMIAEAEEMSKEGVFIFLIADALGIHRTTWYDWLAKGEKENKRLCEGYYDDISLFDEAQQSIYLDFYIRTKKASMKFLRKLLNKVTNVDSVQKPWLAWLSLLKLRYQDYREHKDPAVVVNNNNQIKATMTYVEAMEVLEKCDEQLFDGHKLITDKIAEAKVTTAEVVE
jgi:transposase